MDSIVGHNFTNVIGKSHAKVRKNILPRLSLMPHQRAAIAQIIWSEHNYKELGRRANVYAENLGSGKTRVALGVIALQPIPPVFMPESYKHGNGIRLHVTSKNRQYLRQNIIIVKGDVYEAWRAEIVSGLPKAKVAYIQNVRAFDEYMLRWNNNHYDIVLIKSGTMSKSDGGSKLRNIVDEFAKSVSIIFARVIVDDYEQLGSINNLPKALSYLAISTTSRRHLRAVTNPTEDIYASAFNGVPSFKKIPCIRCNSEALRKWLAMPLIVFRKVVIKAPFALAMAFGKMDGEIGEIVSALAGDAINKASKLLGITAITPADIYQALLGKFYNRLNAAKARVERLDKVLNTMRALAKTRKPPFPQFILESGIAIRHWVNGNSEAMIELEPAEGFSAFYKEFNGELQEELRAAKMEVDITRESLSRQQCEVCNAAVGADLAAVIVKCCSKMSCAECIKRTIKFWKKRGDSGNVCPFNAKHRLVKNSLVYISEQVDLQLVASEDVNSTHELIQVDKMEEIPEKEPEKTYEIESKLDAVLRIISGENIGERTDMPVEGLTKGEQYIEPPKEKKIVIFVGWDETIETLTQMFKKNDIKSAVLQGSSKEIQNKIDNFRYDPYQRALLINSDHHVSGFNLQFATDLIFYGKIRADDVLSQAAGRIQRIGRSCSATVWQLLYENE